MAKKNWQLVYKGDIDDFENDSLDYWLDKSAEEKFSEVENLRKEYKAIKGISEQDESRLLRSTAIIKR